MPNRKNIAFNIYDILFFSDDLLNSKFSQNSNYTMPIIYYYFNSENKVKIYINILTYFFIYFVEEKLE
jgi:hypothetical protein